MQTVVGIVTGVPVGVTLMASLDFILFLRTTGWS